MCLVLIAFHHHPEFPVVIAANRDEFFTRPTAPVHFWEENPSILGGRDLEKGGTWMAVHRSGRFAAVTNYYEPSPRQAGKRSRGELVTGYLAGNNPPQTYITTIAGVVTEFDGFNLFAGDLDRLCFISSRSPTVRTLTPGILGLSNGELDYPWPKVNKGLALFNQLLEHKNRITVDELFNILNDREPPADYVTAVDDSGNRTPRPIFVSDGAFGTRSSTVLLIDNDLNVLFSEKSFNRQGSEVGQVEKEFSITRPSIPH